jgi:tRNA(His) 5'-end guanylyltransferase
VVRLDGAGFSRYTRDLVKPFDDRFATDMDTVALTLAAEFPGTLAAYVASDEISLVTTDLTGDRTEPHLGGVLPKIVSLTAARAAVAFNALRADLHTTRHLDQLPIFDSRAFTITDRAEVGAYLAWRLSDTRRNALAMLCDAHLGKKVTRGKGSAERVAMLAESGVDWTATDPRHAHGRFVLPQRRDEVVTYRRRDTGQEQSAVTSRKVWVVENAPERLGPQDVERLLTTV